MKKGLSNPRTPLLSSQSGVSPLPPARNTPPRTYSPVTELRNVKFAVPVVFTCGMFVMLMEKERAPEGTVEV